MNSVKSIIARVQSLKETGFDEEDGTQVNQVSKALAEVGIQLVDTQGNFRNFGNVMDELGAKWSTLSNRQQAYIATTVAGSYQQSRFLNLMEGYKESVELYKGALDSTGISQKKFALYEDSNAAAITRLKNAWSGIWQSSFDSDTIKNVVDALTSLTQTFDKLVKFVGILPVMFGSFATAAALLSKNFRTLTLSVISLGNGFKGLGISATVAKTAIRSLLASTLVGVGFAALGFALEKIIGLLFSTKDATDDYSKNMKDLVVNTDESITKLIELNEQYKASVGTQEELNNVKKQMIEIMPEIVDHYDAEGNAIFKTSKQIEELIEQEKRLNAQRKQNLLDTMSERLAPQAKEIGSTQKDISGLNKSRSDAKASYEALSFAEQYINKNDLKNLDSLSDEYIQKMNYLRSEIDKIFAANNAYSDPLFLTKQLQLNDGDISKAAESAKVEFGKINTAIDDSKEHISETAKAFSDEFKSVINDLTLSNYNISDKNATSLLNNVAEAFVQTKQITKDNAADIINEYQKFASSLGKYLSTNKIDVTKAIESGNVESLSKALTDSGLSAEIANKVLSQYASTLNEVSESASNIDRVSAQMNAAFKANSDEIKYLNNILADLNNNQYLSAEAMADLIAKYPELARLAVHTAKGWKIEESALQDLRETTIAKTFDDMEAEKTSTLNTINGTLARIGLYQLEAKSIATLADAKKTYSDLEDKKNDVVPRSGDDFIKIGNYEQAQSSLNELIGLMEQAESLKAVISDPNFGVSPKTTPKDKGGGGGSKDDPSKIDATQAYINLVNKEADARHKVNEELSKRADELSNEGKYAQAIQKTNVLIKSQAKELSILGSANKQLSAKRKAIDDSTNYDLSSFVDANGEATQAYSAVYNSLKTGKEQQALQELFNKYQAYTKAIQANFVAMKDLNDEKKKTLQMLAEEKEKLAEQQLQTTTTYMEKRNKTVERYNYLLEMSEKRTQLYNEGSKEYNRELVIQADIRRKTVKYYENEIAWIKKRINQGNLNAKQLEYLNSLLKEYASNLLDAQIALKSAAKESYDDWLGKAGDIADKAIDKIKKVFEEAKDAALDSIDKQMEAEDKRHEERIQNLDDEKEKFDNTVDEILKSMDRLEAKNDYNKELVSKQKDASTLQNKISELALDDTIEGKKKREDLEAELASKLSEIEDFQHDRTIELRKESLEDLKEKNSDATDSKKKMEDDDYNHYKSTLEKKKKAEEAYWNEILNNEQYFAELRTSILNGNLDAMNTALQGFSNNVSSHMNIIGESITKNLLDKLNEAGQLLGTINYSTTASNPLGMKPDDYSKYLENKRIYETSTDKTAKSKAASENASLRSKYNISSDTYSYDQLKKIASADQGGMTPSWGPEGKVMMVHEDELILNKFDSASLLNLTSAFSWVKDSLLNIMKPNLSQLAPSYSNNVAGDNVYNINLNVTATGSIKGGQDLAEGFAKYMKKIGR